MKATHLGLCGAIAALAAAVSTAQTGNALGTPLPGITPVEFEEFRLGLDDFLEVEASEEGLGPAFNGTSCAVCHNIPTIGGAGTMAELRAGRRNAAGEFEALDATGTRVPAHPAGRHERVRTPRAHSALWRRTRGSHS
jgi:hypothetical protein